MNINVLLTLTLDDLKRSPPPFVVCPLPRIYGREVWSDILGSDIVSRLPVDGCCLERDGGRAGFRGIWERGGWHTVMCGCDLERGVDFLCKLFGGVPLCVDVFVRIPRDV